MPQSACFVCQQGFDNRGRLRDHLQQNPSHRRGRRRSGSESVKPSVRPQTRTQTKVRELTPVVLEGTNARVSTASERQQSGGRPVWSRVAAEQDAYLRQVVPSKCHSPETLEACQYHIGNRTRVQLEQLQKCVNCHSKLQHPSRKSQLTPLGKRHDRERADQPCVFHLDRRAVKVIHISATELELTLAGQAPQPRTNLLCHSVPRVSDPT